MMLWVKNDHNDYQLQFVMFRYALKTCEHKAKAKVKDKD